MGSEVFRGDEPPRSRPLPQGESVVSEREGFSSCAPASRGPRLASRVPRRRRALSLARGEERRKTPNQSGRGAEEPKRPREACARRPLTQAPGSWRQSRLPQPPGLGPASSGGREGALRAIFGPNRRAPQIQTGGAGLEDTERQTQRLRRGDKGRSRGAQGQPEEVKSGQEGAKAPPAARELLLPQSRI